MEGTITNSLIQGLTEKMVQARVNSYDVRPFYYAKHFPLKKIIGFDWKMLENQIEKMNVAADIHTDNGTFIRKHRPLFQISRGDIPFIVISRDLKRSELKDLQTMLALADDPTKRELVDLWGKDVDFCFGGVQYELEDIAWRLACNAGKLEFNTGNNATFANEYDLDYDVDAEQKVKTDTDWNNSANADIIGDLRKIIEAARKQGRHPKYGFINMETLFKICSADQIIKACASYAQNALNMAQTPDLAQVNMMLAKQAWLYGIQLVVIDQDVTREPQIGNSVTANPFAVDRMILAESLVLGSTQYDILAENSPLILKAQRGHTIVKRYGTVEPQSEVTIGQCDAIPVFDSAYRNVYVKTNAQDW